MIKALDESWPDHPEWVDMLVGILNDEPMGPSYGWFRTAVAQTRFDWAATRKRYDRDDDGRIARAEFPGDDADFARLDRDHDKALDRRRFRLLRQLAGAARPARCCSCAPIATATARSRARSSTRSSRPPISGGQGFLSLADLQEAFTPPAGRPASAGSSSGRPSKATLVRGLFRQEIGSLQPGPKLDESAPDFTLKTNDGKAEITLSKLVGPKPVVLVFGNFTCGPFRSQSGNIEKLYRSLQGPRDVRDGLRPRGTPDRRLADGKQRPAGRDRPRSRKPTTNESPSRRSAAGSSSLGFPMLVDTIDDAAGARYSGMPGRLYVIDREGKVAYKSGRGPYLFKPAELEHSLVLLLQEDGTARSSKTKVSLKDQSTPRDGAGQKRSAANE